MTTLAQLLPRTKTNIIDVVEAVGHDTAPWGFKEGGKTPVKDPKVNPNYCYRWCFSQPEKPSLLCVWHDSLIDESGVISHHGNLRESAIELERKAEDPRLSKEIGNRAKKHAKESRRMDSVVIDSFRRQAAIRVAIIHSKVRKPGEIERSSASYRELDAEPWTVAHYDMQTGEYRIVRSGLSESSHIQMGERPSINPEMNPGIDTKIHPGIDLEIDPEIDSEPQPANPEEHFEDQFSGTDSPTYTTKTGEVAYRDPRVRNQVLLRANGRCEYCSELGFVTKSGKLYLETHHAVPLCEGGADRVSNVIALCSNHHREAHYSLDAGDLREIFLEYLDSLYES